MAIVRRNVKPDSKPSAGVPVKKTISGKVKSGLTLPTKKSTPARAIEEFTWLIYGEKKIGKTSLCSCFPSSLIFSFEPGTKALEAFTVDIPNWETGLQYVEKLASDSSHSFKNVVVDTGKIAYDRCLQYSCSQADISYPGDLPYGKGWNILSKNFERFHLDMTGLGIGLVIVAHEKTIETENSVGLKQIKTEPDLSGAALSFYHGMVDIVGRYHFIGEKRFLTIRGNANEVAGCRMSSNFLTPSGERVVRIPMGENEAEAYSNVVKAFNNKQIHTYEDVELEPKKPRTGLQKRR